MSRAKLAKLDIWIEKAHKDGLRELSKGTGASLSWLVRDAVRLYIERANHARAAESGKVNR